MPCVYKHDFFVSYPHMPDGNIVMKFVDELVRAIEFLRTGPRLPEPVYRDATRLLPGFRWGMELARALCHSRAMLAVYTDEYFTREYCQAEWNAMVELEMRRLGKSATSMIIPILFRAANDGQGNPVLPAMMSGLQYEDFRTILSPEQQMRTVRSRQKVQRLLTRIDDLVRARRGILASIAIRSSSRCGQSLHLRPPRRIPGRGRDERRGGGRADRHVLFVQRRHRPLDGARERRLYPRRG